MSPCQGEGREFESHRPLFILLNGRGTKLKILKQDKKGNKVSIEIDVPYEEFAKARDKVIADISSTMKVPGFRPGKAPSNIIKQNLNMEFAKEKAVDLVVEQSYPEILKQTAIEPVDYPSWKPVAIEDGVKCVISFEVEVMPEIKLGKYTGIKGERKNSDVEEKEIDDYIKMITEESSQVSEVKDRAVKNGDIAELNITGKIADKVESRLSQNNLPILIGDNRVAPGFDANIEGMAIGDTKEFSISLPADYYIKEFAEQEVSFTVTVLKILERIMPEFNDEFVKKISSFANVAEYREDVKKRIGDFKKHKNDDELKDSLLDQVMNSCEIDIPNALIAREIETMVSELKMNLDRQGLTIENYIKSRQMAPQDLKKELEPSALKRVKARLVLKEISDKEKIEFSDSDFTEELKLLSKEMNVPEAELMTREGIREYIKDYVLRRKALDFIVENAKIKEK